MSQSRLARQVGLTQGTISGLISGRSRSSAYLHLIARSLNTTIGYLTGEIDDPSPEAAPPPAEPIEFVMMAVAMPPRRALTRMFESLLRAMPPGADLDEQAELLAERLPIGLAQLRDLLPVLTPSHAESMAGQAA